MSSEIIFLYDQVMEYMTYIVGLDAPRKIKGTTDLHDEMEHFEPILFNKNMLLFSASLRNLAEASGTSVEMKKHSVKNFKISSPIKYPFFVDLGNNQNLYKSLSRIMHSTRTEFIRAELYLPINDVDPINYLNVMKSRSVETFQAGTFFQLRQQRMDPL